MNELQEIREMVTEQMEAEGFIRPTVLLVGTKPRLGVTFTSFPGGLDAAVMLTPSIKRFSMVCWLNDVGRCVPHIYSFVNDFGVCRWHTA